MWEVWRLGQHHGPLYESLVFCNAIKCASCSGLWFVLALVKNKSLRMAIVLVLVIGIFSTAGIAKYKHNTSPQWPPGVAWTSAEEVSSYVWMSQNLPRDSKVFTYSKDDSHVIGFDMQSCFWCEDVIAFRKDIIQKSGEDLLAFLQRNNYDYLIVSGMSYKYLGRLYGDNESRAAIDDILAFAQAAPELQPVHQSSGAVIFQVK